MANGHNKYYPLELVSLYDEKPVNTKDEEENYDDFWSLNREVVTFEAKKMHRFSRLSLEMPAKHSNEIQRKPRAKKKRSKKKRLISNIATLDNGTMVEMFKFLNYCQLAKNSLVSKKFRDLIRTHRHSLALLYVNSLIMINFSTSPSLIIFGQQLSPEAYNKWARRNGYSKWIPIDDQVVGKKSALDHRKVYELWANACYKSKAFVSL
ncbi:hypothetical protein DdX_15731 [Ditylenchus destructor]|uniref:F-box domain-containing protein n=1 Tax=Ditylenchus destructor TaxID=166010 RepID=A0AAD4MRQ6_9BILA|nr:hypothetical protein DdX_15731 [Ditylenchus destructor]